MKLGLLTQRSQHRNFLRQKVKRFFSRPEKRELKEGKQMENVAVFTSLSKLLGVKLEIRVIYKVQQEIKVGVRKDQTFQIGF